MSEKEENLIVEVVPAEVIYQQDKATIDMQIATAKQYPRNLKRAIDNSVAIVTLDQQTASTCHYALPRAGKTIQGPSVHLAKILAQQWGNMRIEAKVVSTDKTTLTSQAVAFDLENNLAIKVEVKRSIMTKTGRMSEDMIVVTGNAANSIALRNAILSVIPKAVVDKVYGSAKQVLTGDVSDETKLIARRKKVFDEFKDSYGVTEKQLLEVIKKASIDHVGADDIATLVGLWQAIKDGDTTIDATFNNTKSEVLEIDPAELEASFELVKSKVSASDKTSVERILKNKEKASYHKVKQILEKYA